MSDMNKLDMEQGTIEGIKSKVAGKISDALTGTAEKSKGLCIAVAWGEPIYPVELLTEE